MDNNLEREGLNVSEVIASPREILHITVNALRSVDERLLGHGERVAFIAYEIAQQGGLGDELDLQTLVVTSIFHDIGAFKTAEIARMIEFEDDDDMSHAIYGYLFLRDMTPLGNAAEAVLYHHVSHAAMKQVDTVYREYSELIHLADCVDILLNRYGQKADFSVFEEEAGTRFSPCYVDLLLGAVRDRDLVRRVPTEGLQTIERLVSDYDTPKGRALSYLEMLVYSIDFRSQYTVVHSVNTASISLALARVLGLDPRHQSIVYYGALIHDLGKLAIPTEILEYPGKLNAEQWAIMKTHVVETDNIISGVVSEEVRRIAVRHHEKIDGIGYPEGLTGNELTLEERIVAVADVVSALNSERSYKAAFPKEKTLGILQQLRDTGQLCPLCCDAAMDHYDDIMDFTEECRNPWCVSTTASSRNRRNSFRVSMPLGPRVNELPQGVEQLPGVDGLHEMRVNASLPGLLSVLVESVCRKGHYGNGLGVLVP